MMPNLAFLLATEDLLKKIANNANLDRLISEVEIDKSSETSERMTLSNILTKGSNKQLTQEEAESLAKVYGFCERVIDCAYINGDRLFYNASGVISNTVLTEDDDLLTKQRKLMAAWCIRRGYRLREEIGDYIAVIAPTGLEYINNLHQCDCQWHSSSVGCGCHHLALSREYVLDRKVYAMLNTH